MPLDVVAVWLEALGREPKQAVADLLCGRLPRGQFARLECAEFIQRALADAVPVERARSLLGRLDQGLGEWLAEAMAHDAEWRRRDGLQAHLYRLGEALATVGLIGLPQTAYRLRELSPAYRRWLQRYDYGYGDSPYAAYWRALGSTQKDPSLRQQWHEFVANAGDQGHPRYLQPLGLAGLRRLPVGAVERQLAMINAVLRRAWRLRTEEAVGEFAERLAALRAEFPMANDTWRGRALRLVQLLEEDEQSRPSWNAQEAARLNEFRARLLAAVQPFIGDLDLGYATACSIEIPSLPTFDEGVRTHHELLAKKPMAIGRALDLFERHRRYAEASGDSYFFVRTLCNLGHRLLRNPGADAAAMDSLRDLLRHALALEPGNAYSWSFWAELEQAQGEEDVAEAVLWEAVRRFPDNEPTRVELALLLQRRHAREQTHSLLAEAEQLLREVVAANPRSEHSRSELARLLARSGRQDNALSLLREWLAVRDNPFWRRMLSDIEAGKALSLPQPGLGTPTRGPVNRAASAVSRPQELDALRASAVAARFARARERGEAGNPLDLTAAAEQYDVPRFYLGWFGAAVPSRDEEGLHLPYALAALRAMAAPHRWQELERDYPGRERDTLLLKLYTGTPVAREARAELARWLEVGAGPVETALSACQAEDSDRDDEDETGVSPARPVASSYDDFLRRRLRETAFVAASEQGRLATATRSGEYDRIIERHLARSIDADLPPVSLAA